MLTCSVNKRITEVGRFNKKGNKMSLTGELTAPDQAESSRASPEEIEIWEALYGFGRFATEHGLTPEIVPDPSVPGGELIVYHEPHISTAA